MTKGILGRTGSWHLRRCEHRVAVLEGGACRVQLDLRSIEPLEQVFVLRDSDLETRTGVGDALVLVGLGGGASGAERG